MLGSWVEAGAPRGEAENEPPCPELSGDWQLREPDLVVTLGHEVVVPDDGPDLFRNFVIPVSVDRARFVKAVEIQPRSPAVHHAVLAVQEEEKRRLETERVLAEEVHAAYREKMAAEIRQNPDRFMKSS